MLKFLQSYDEAIDLVYMLKEKPKLSAFKLGLAGSFRQSMMKKSSPIDVVLKLKDGEDKDLIGSLDILALIRRATVNEYSNKIQVIWLDLLEEDEENLLNYVRKIGIEANPESAYTNIVDEVRWIEDEEDDGSDNDRISASVMTWDDEEDSGISVEDLENAGNSTDETEEGDEE